MPAALSWRYTCPIANPEFIDMRLMITGGRRAALCFDATLAPLPQEHAQGRTNFAVCHAAGTALAFLDTALSIVRDQLAACAVAFHPIAVSHGPTLHRLRRIGESGSPVCNDVSKIVMKQSVGN